MKNQTKPTRPSTGSRVIASIQDAVDWVEGQDVGRADDDGGSARDRPTAVSSPLKQPS